jgi:hypothetical protein
MEQPIMQDRYLSEERLDDNSNNENSPIYRYKFTQSFMTELFKFSKIHQYDDRKVFKEAWETWTQENDELISSEIARLQKLEYNGDILEKMFKSARYYFRKKSPIKSEPKERRKYVSIHKELLDAMDAHVSSGKNKEDYKPSDGFTDFCNTHQEELKQEITLLLENDMNSDEIMNKFKKTYKNRYFMSITK